MIEKHPNGCFFRLVLYLAASLIAADPVEGIELSRGLKVFKKKQPISVGIWIAECNGSGNRAS